MTCFHLDNPREIVTGRTRMLVNGHNLYLERHGPKNGPLVVLLHHGLGTAHAWKEQISPLVAAGYQVIAYDRWGYGNSDPRPALDLPTFSTDLQDLCTILEQLGIHRLALVGHSDGGSMALYYAIRHPEQSTCIVAVAAHIYVEAEMEPGILGVAHAFEHDERFRHGLQRAHGDQFEGVFHNWFDGWHRHQFLTWDMRPVLCQVHCPVLVVQGQLDEYATPQHARDIAASIDGAELWLVPTAGHMLPQENANLFNPRLLQFLDRNHV